MNPNLSAGLLRNIVGFTQVGKVKSVYWKLVYPLYQRQGFINMSANKSLLLVLILFLVFAAGCSAVGFGRTESSLYPGFTPGDSVAVIPDATVIDSTPANLPTINEPGNTPPSRTPTQTASPTSTITPTPTATELVFDVGEELTIDYLRDLKITGSEITFEKELEPTLYYKQYLASYISEGNKIYGLLLIPAMAPPEGGFKAIVFNHGYIPPAAYQTTERYTAYVDYLARAGFVVFKIDYRGHGQSEGEPSGSYFSPGYTIDSIAALKSLQTLDMIDPQGIGMWGHSMAGNLVLRAMLIEPDIKAGVIWAGAVYSYDDFVKYGINDTSYRPPVASGNQGGSNSRSRSQEIFDTYGRPNTQVDYWKAVSLTENIQYLNRPLQLHHAEDDPVVNIGYSFDLAVVLQENGKQYEFYSYEGGGHNLVSPYFDQAMLRTVEFFRNNL
jgi:pimeloyl-ACP methyl ester carboxylesterase